MFVQFSGFTSYEYAGITFSRFLFFAYLFFIFNIWLVLKLNGVYFNIFILAFVFKISSLENFWLNYPRIQVINWITLWSWIRYTHFNTTPELNYNFFTHSIFIFYLKMIKICWYLFCSTFSEMTYFFGFISSLWSLW